MSLKSISRCVLAFGRVRSPPSRNTRYLKSTIRGPSLEGRTLNVLTVIVFAWVTSQTCMRHGYYTYTTLLLYRHRIRFVVRTCREIQRVADPPLGCRSPFQFRVCFCLEMLCKNVFCVVLGSIVRLCMFKLAGGFLQECTKSSPT